MKLARYWIALFLTIALLVSGSSGVLAANAQGQAKIAPTEASPPHPFNIIDTDGRRLVDGSVAVFRINGVETVIPLDTHKPYNTAKGMLPAGMGGGDYQVSVRQPKGTEFLVGMFKVIAMPTNQAPILSAIGNKTVNEGSQLTFTASATDLDGNPLTLSASNLPDGATFNPVTGTFTWTPSYNQAGSYNVTVSVSDGYLTDSETITITVNNVNQAPVAQNDLFTTAENTTFYGNILANDTDVDGSILTAALVSGPSYGTVVLNSDGSFIYTPVVNYNGSDSFTYKAFDGAAYSNAATVNITVFPVNDAPVAHNDLFTTAEDTPLTILPSSLLANDSDVDNDTLSIISYTQPSHGTVSLVSGNLVYTPNFNFNGTDSFTYTVSDGHGGTSTATVNITVNPVNDMPILVAIDNQTVNEGSSLTFTIMATDLDNDPLILSALNLPNGATFDSQGNFTWTPSYDQAGTYNVTVAVSDGSLIDSKTITIMVNDVNRVPVADAGPDLYGQAGQTVTLDGSASNDPDGTIALYEWDLNNDGLYTDGSSVNINFTIPNSAPVYSVYTVMLRVTDNDGFTATDTVLINVQAPPEAPVVQEVVQEQPQDAPVEEAPVEEAPQEAPSEDY